MDFMDFEMNGGMETRSSSGLVLFKNMEWEQINRKRKKAETNKVKAWTFSHHRHHHH